MILSLIKDNNFKYIYVNNMFCNLFNISLNNVIGKRDSDFILDKNLLNTCNQSDIYTLENNFLVCTEKSFNKSFEVLKLKINLGNDKIGILCFAKIKKAINLK